MNRLKSLLSGSLMALAVLAFAHVVRAQVITVTPATVTDPSHPMAFNNVPLGATSQPQYITVAASTLTTAVVTPNSFWLVFPAGQIYHPGPNGVNIPVAVSAAGLSQGTYTGSFAISVSQYIAATVYVSITVNGSSALAAYPSSLFFSAQQGALSAVPSSTVVTITSSGTPLAYTLYTQVQAGDPNWIALSTTTGVTGYGGFVVQLNPSSLSVGTHSGFITAFSTGINDSVTINVTLMVYPNSVLSVTPSAPPPFVWQVGTNDPPAQQFSVTAASGTVAFSARLSPLVAWASLSPFNSPAGLVTPATLTVTPTPSYIGLTQGTYTTYLIVSPAGGPDLPALPITLIATGYPFLQLSTTSLSFSAQFGSAQAPPDQPVTVTSSGLGSVGFTFTSDSPWLSAVASFPVTPSTLTVHVNPIGLPLGMTTGNLTIFPTNGANFAQTISVNLMVVSSAQLTVGSSQLLFSYQTGYPPPSTQTVQIQSSGDPVSFTLATATASCGSNWLSAVPSSYTTPATLTVSVLTPSFVPVSCQGIITLNYDSGSGPASVVIYVTVAVSGNSELVVSTPAGFGDETAAQGAPAYTRQIFLSSTDFRTPVGFSASVFNLNGGFWLGIAGITTGLTPQTLTIRINPSAVPGPGFYSGNLVISSFSLPNGFITIPITLRVISAVTVSVSPTSLSFSQTQGGPAPGAQILSLTGSGANPTFTATIAQISSGNWLRVSPTSGQANGYLQVSVLSNLLPQGDYPAQILFTFPNATPASITVYVTLHVGPALKTVSVSEPALRFSYQIGGSQPAAQKFSVTSTGGPVDFTVGYTSSGWLSADVSKGTTPRDVNVLVNTQGLTVSGSPYSGSISISAPGVLANAININVTLTVTGVPVPVPATVANNASGAFGAIAPGELITIKGTALALDSAAGGVLFHVNAQGGVDSTLGGVRVLFSGIPGTPIYVSPGQINVIAPYEIEGFVSTTIVVENQGVQSAPIPVAVVDFAPGLYSDNLGGSGQVAAVNANGTLNGAAGGGFSPAAQGSVLTVYATGFGQSSPHSITGSVTPIPHTDNDLLRVKGSVTATIGGQNADVVFAGAAPGMVTGIVQLNIKVPNAVSGTQLPISVSVNGKTTPLIGTTVAVQ
jgi:trimeric autotransporter adhesin